MPAFNIDKFRSHLDKRGTLLTNKFDVEFQVPGVLQNIYSNNYADISETLNYRAEQIRLPGISLDAFPVNRYGLGPAIKFPTSASFTDISVTFTEDRNVTLWKFHNEWISRIFDYTGTNGQGATGPYTLQYRKNYVIDIVINVYNNSPLDTVQAVPEPTIIVVLKEAYPISINDINLDWSQNNNLFKPTVTYTFKSWYIKGLIKDPIKYKGRFVNPGEYFANELPTPPPASPPSQQGSSPVSRQRPIILP